MMEQKRIDQGSVALVSWLIMIALNFFQLLYIKVSVESKYEWSDVLYYPITSLTIGIFLIYFWLLPLFKKIRKLNLGFQIPLFILHGLSYTTVYILLIFLQITIWSEDLYFNQLPETIHKFFYTDFHNIAKNYFFLLAIYIAVEYVNKRAETLLKQKELENQLKEAKLQALESKLHPHFLFNALNGITALVNENPKKAEKAIIELSDLLRFALEGNLHKPISLKEELEFVEKYTSIEKMRYEDQLEVNISVDNGVDLNRPIIPPLILQPILENAIIHGFKGINHTLHISLQVGKQKIAIRNNGSPLKKGARFSTGLRIVEQRIKHHYRGEAVLKLFEDEGQVICEINGLNL